MGTESSKPQPRFTPQSSNFPRSTSYNQGYQSTQQPASDTFRSTNQSSNFPHSTSYNQANRSTQQPTSDTSRSTNQSSNFPNTTSYNQANPSTPQPTSDTSRSTNQSSNFPNTTSYNQANRSTPQPTSDTSRVTNQSSNFPRTTSYNQENRSTQQPVSDTSRSIINSNSPSELRPTQYSYSTDQLRSITSQSNVESLYPNLRNAANQRNEQQNSNSPGTAAATKTSSPMTSARPGTSTPSPMNNFTPGAASIYFTTRRSATPSAPIEQDLPPAASYSVRRKPQHGPLTEQHCQTCKQLFGENIYQCSNGHSACDRCRTRAISCGVCGGVVLDMRNFSVEEHLRTLKVSCPNKEYGCVLNLRRADMTTHLRECIFRDMDCPLNAVFGMCTWKGKRGADMLRHFDERHPGNRRLDVNEEGLLARPCNDTRQVHLVVLDHYFFVVHIKVSEANQTFSMAVQLLGTKTGASKWTVEINLYNKADPRRKLSYHDACAPDGDNINDIFNENRCLVLPLAYIRSFANERGLNYKFFIRKTLESKRPQQRPARNARQWSQTRNKQNWRES